MRKSWACLTKNARLLRRNMTDAEYKLWRYLRNRGVENVKFRRQVPLGKYIVDFFCHEKNLVVEVDGGQHAVNEANDKERDAWLAEHGYQVLRFWNHDVLRNIEGVLEVIWEHCRNSPHPGPLPEGEGEKRNVGGG